jgi:hypothetical protein
MQLLKFTSVAFAHEILLPTTGKHSGTSAPACTTCRPLLLHPTPPAVSHSCRQVLLPPCLSHSPQQEQELKPHKQGGQGQGLDQAVHKGGLPALKKAMARVDLRYGGACRV